MSGICFADYRLEENTHYFLYIGELKNYGLNLYLREALSRHFDRPVEFISIVPDVFEQYYYENLIVINPEADDFVCRYGRNMSCRVPAEKFFAGVSESPAVRALIQKLLGRQDHLYIYMYESMPQMTLDATPGVSILGPASHIARRLNSKIYQYRHLGAHVPLVDFHICSGFDEMNRTTQKLWSQWTDGIFVSQAYSAAGSNNMIARGPEDICKRFRTCDETFLVSRFVPHRYDPTVLAVVANENDVYIAGVADQCIEKGTRFCGSTFPTKLDDKTVADLKAYTRIVGRWLASEGYRGIYGCDYLVDDNGGIFFLEVNARKQGTTMEFCCTLEQSLPAGAPLLPELEYHAVTKGRFPEGTVEMEKNEKNIHWGTYNYKIDASICTNGYIPQGSNEREAFRKVAGNNLKKDFLILEHIGNDFIVARGSFLGRIVSLGQDAESVRQGLNQGKKIIELTIGESDLE